MYKFKVLRGKEIKSRYMYINKYSSICICNYIIDDKCI